MALILIIVVVLLVVVAAIAGCVKYARTQSAKLAKARAVAWPALEPRAAEPLPQPLAICTIDDMNSENAAMPAIMAPFMAPGEWDSILARIRPEREYMARMMPLTLVMAVTIVGALFFPCVLMYIALESQQGIQQIFHEAGERNPYLRFELKTRRVGRKRTVTYIEVVQEAAPPNAKAVQPTMIAADAVVVEPVPVEESPADKLLKLKTLLDAGALTQAEFDEKKEALMDRI